MSSHEEKGAAMGRCRQQQFGRDNLMREAFLYHEVHPNDGRSQREAHPSHLTGNTRGGNRNVNDAYRALNSNPQGSGAHENTQICLAPWWHLPTTCSRKLSSTVGVDCRRNIAPQINNPVTRPNKCRNFREAYWAASSPSPGVRNNWLLHRRRRWRRALLVSILDSTSFPIFPAVSAPLETRQDLVSLIEVVHVIGSEIAVAVSERTGAVKKAKTGGLGA